jgi:uncharacterized protein (TIGR02246 family)
MSMQPEDLLARLRELEDREEIRSLLHDYRRALDARDLRGFAELFASEGKWRGGMGEATGPQAIHDMLAERLPDNPPAPESTLWHLVTEPAIVLDGDRATADSFWLHIRRGDGDAPVTPKLGSYEDELVREDGRWRFLRRTVAGLIPHAPAPGEG